MMNSVKDFRGKIKPPVEKGVLKIERYAQRLTQGYSAYGGSYLWAPGTSKFFQRQPKLHEPVGLVQFVVFEKNYKCLFISNCPRKIM